MKPGNTLKAAWASMALLLAACSAQPSDNLPMTVVALRGASSSQTEWQAPPTPAFTATPSPAAQSSSSTATPATGIRTPTPVPPMPMLILPVYQISRDDLVLLNGEVISDILHVDTNVLTLVENTTIAMEIIPDSELVYGSAYAKFDTAAFVDSQDGPLASYRETVEGQVLTGPQVVDYVARQYSVGPRVLLALLEYSGGWVTKPSPDWVASDFHVGLVNPQWRGLQAQLTWAANHLNYGYYGRKQRGVGAVRFADDTYTMVSSELNAGTVAVQMVLGLTRSYKGWETAVSVRGFLATYRALFGDPFQYDQGPPLPADLQQPFLDLPWGKDETWYYSGGPHGGWGGGSAWAAVDFVPPGPGGCYTSDDWVRASADGVVVRSQLGMVVVDLDGDGLEQTGWVLNYAHIAARERVVTVGTRLKAGDPIGHPSCEGGVSTGTHLHFTRRYNGEWVMAGSGHVPMVLAGWTVRQARTAYDGEMIKGDRTLTAIAGRSQGNNDVTR